MKLSFLIILSIFIIPLSWADSKFKTLELSSSFLTHHFSQLNADRFENPVSEDGRTINNPLYGFTYSYSDNTDFYNSFTLFSGEDSIGSPMQGFSFTGGFGDITSSTVQFGWVWGMYFYDESAWEERFADREAQTPSWLYAYYVEQWRGVNMIFGLELNFKFDITDHTFIKIRNTVTPMISNHSLSIGFEF